MSSISRMKEKPYWATERQKLENARRLRGIYFNDPEDNEKCTAEVGSTSRHGYAFKDKQKGDHKSQDESKRLRVERLASKNHEDHIAGKGDNSLRRGI